MARAMIPPDEMSAFKHFTHVAPSPVIGLRPLLLKPQSVPIRRLPYRSARRDLLLWANDTLRKIRAFVPLHREKNPKVCSMTTIITLWILDSKKRTAEHLCGSGQCAPSLRSQILGIVVFSSLNPLCSIVLVTNRQSQYYWSHISSGVTVPSVLALILSQFDTFFCFSSTI